MKGGKSGQGDQRGDYGSVTGGMSMAWMRIVVAVAQGGGGFCRQIGGRNCRTR